MSRSRLPWWAAPLFAMALAACSDGTVAGPAASSIALASSSARAGGAAVAGAYDWLQFNGGPDHSGNNTQESALAAGNVGGLQRLFQISLPVVFDNAPVALSAVVTASGSRDLVYLTTRAGELMALDAHSGATVWTAAHGPGSCHINNGSSGCYTTSAPAIDPARAFVYSYGLDGYVHKHAVGDGSEVTGGGWPALASTKPFEEKSSPALGWATAASGATFLYVSNGGYPGDNGDYQGHITAIDLASGSQQVFNTLCSDQALHFVERPGTPDCAQVQAAVWARSGVVYDTARDDIILSTGNGNFDGNHDFGDSVLTLHPDGSGAGGRPLDSYTPTNFQQLQDADADIGSTAPALLPPVTGSRVAHLAVQSGKDAKLRLLDRDHLSGQGGPGHTGGEIGAIVDVPQGGEVLTAIATFSRPSDGSVFIFVANDNGLSALRVVVDGAGNPALSTVWQHSGQRTSPLLANGLLYAAGSGIIEALDPSSGARLWSDTRVGGLHWASPLVVNGVLYLADTAAHLTAWTLPATTLPPPWQSSDVGAVALAGSASAAGGTFTVSGAGDDIWNNADAFRYVYQPLAGDGSIVARVVAVGNTNPWAKAGVMIRETLAAGSRHALMAITPGNGAAFQRRTSTDGISTHTAGPSVTAPYWVRLSRSGATITGSVSSDGSSWTVVGSDTIAMAASVFIGLAVTAHDNSQRSTSSFDNVTVGGGGGGVKINFQLATTTTPPGYLPDAGAVFADRGNGFSYGWNLDNSANARERHAANSPDIRYDTLAHLQKPSNPNASWQIALPNGSYAVRIVAGDAQHTDSVYALDANGVHVVGGAPSAGSLWFDGTATVPVSNGRLTVGNGAGSSNNKIDFIEIVRQ